MRLRNVLSPSNPKFIVWLFLVMFFMLLIFALQSCNTVNKHKSLSKSTVDSTFTSVYDSAKTSNSKSIKLSIIDSSKLKSKVTKNGVTIEFETDTAKAGKTANTEAITIEKKDGKTIINLGGRKAKRITDTNFESDVQLQKDIVAEKALSDNKDSVKVSKNTNVDLHKKEVTKNNDKSTHRFSWYWIIPVVLVAGVLIYLKFKKV